MPVMLSGKLKKTICSCKDKVVATSLWRKWAVFLESRRWTAFYAKHPSLVEYQKPYRTPQQLTYKLILQGLQVGDRKNAEEIIFRENYFRFKAYAIPFFDQALEKFHPGTTFDDLYRLYSADQELRNFLIPLLAALEVRIRATVDNVITCATNDPFWHLDANYFRNFSDVERALKKAQQRFDQGRQEFVIHYRNRYFTRKSYNYRKTPPFWIISEIFTLEQLLAVCKNLNESCPVFSISAGKNNLDNAAQPFGINSYKSLVTNLSCILELRNLCAHHSRLWNRNLKSPAGIMRKGVIAASHPNRLYSHLVMLRTFCKAQGIPDGIEPFMTRMFSQIPVFSRDMANMGFPANWNQGAIWK